MFKIGDVIVNIGSDKGYMGIKGDIWKIPKIPSCGTGAFNKRGTIWSNSIRKATDNEIKWFEAGITNINQIPEVGGTYINGLNQLRTISKLDYTTGWIWTNETGKSHIFSTFIGKLINRYKPPVKSQHIGNEVPIDTPFKPEDLKNCKIGNLTPEDHKIIQPFLFSLGYTWISGKTEVNITSSTLYIIKDHKICNGTSLETINIKKELILNYIKQLNTNKNEVHRQNQEITRGPINGSARILSGRQQGSTGSRPKGNVTCVKIRETQFRKSEVIGTVRFR